MKDFEAYLVDDGVIIQLLYEDGWIRLSEDEAVSLAEILLARVKEIRKRR